MMDDRGHPIADDLRGGAGGIVCSPLLGSYRSGNEHRRRAWVCWYWVWTADGLRLIWEQAWWACHWDLV